MQRVCDPGIGRALPHVRTYVLDRFLAPVPLAGVGELFLAGPQVALGYLDDPALTSVRFVADPFAADGTRMYATGDLVRLGPDGDLRFLGRRDEQVKVRGFRVELTDVAAALTEVPGVLEAVVRLRGDGLTGFLVTREDLDPEPVRGRLAGRLPGYAVPSRLVRVARIPRTANGKVDEPALLREPELVPAPTGNGAGRPDRDLGVPDGRPGSRPDGQVERRVARVFDAVLERSGTGVADDFFALGGHSLAAVRLASRLSTEFGVEVDLRTVFAAPTPGQLAGQVAAQLRSRPEPSGPPEPAEPQGERGEGPLSSAQERLWLMSRLDPANPAYNMAMAVDLVGELDPAALERALRLVVERHQVLRTVVVEDDGVPRQRVLGLERVPRLVRRPVTAEVLDAVLREQAGLPFDLSRQVPIRYHLWSLTPTHQVLQLVVHHIAFDGWSMSVFSAELSAAYAAFLTGAAPALPRPPMQFAEVAARERGGPGTDGNPTTPARVRFWADYLRGAPAVIELPTDRPRGRSADPAGGWTRFTLPGELWQGLTDLARTCGGTPFMVLHAAFALVLSRWGAGDDVVIGTPTAGRSDPRHDRLIGPFLNDLVLRLDLSGDPTFRQLVERARAADLAALAHADVPFERVVEAVNPVRTMAAHPLFQVLVALDDVSRLTVAMPGLRTSTRVVPTGTARFDLSLYVEPLPVGESPPVGESLPVGGSPSVDEPAGDVVRGSVEYRSDLFDASTVRRMVDGLAGLLRQVVEDPDRPVHRFDVVSPAERTALERLREGARRPVRRTSVPAELDRLAAARPDAPCLVDERGEHTLAQVNGRATALALRLRALGVGPGSIVAVAVPRSAAMVVAMLAAMRAGAAYLPIDLDDPVLRTLVMLQDADPAVIVVDAAVRDTVSAIELPHGCVVVDVDATPGSDPGTCPPGEPAPDPDSAAYLLFTSGSTGRPKGVLVPHSALVSHLDWIQSGYPLRPGDRMLQKTAAGFDVSVVELFWPLLQGIPLVLARPGGHRDVEYLARTVQRHGITLIFFVPSVYEAFLACPAARDCVSLRRVVLTGEVVSVELQRAHADLLPAELVNMYGPTEAAVDVTAWDCRPRAASTARTVPIGSVVDNVTVDVLDRRLRPVPFGVPGELYLGGAQLALGYLHRPGVTAERFVAAAAGPAGSRWYRTGDLVRLRADGVLEFVGRVDNQVKLRGVRIELGEVDAAFEALPEVRRCVTLLREGRTGHPLLVSYLVGEPPVDPAALRRRVAEELPAVMVPTVVVPMDALPALPNGKVDRALLPAPEVVTGPSRPPRTVEEATLLEVVRGVLGLTELGVEDGFFDVGGDSIQVVQVVSRARDAGLELELRDVFEEPTVAGLAARARPAPAPATVPVEPEAPLLELDHGELAALEATWGELNGGRTA